MNKKDIDREKQNSRKEEREYELTEVERNQF